jgi:putative protease
LDQAKKADITAVIVMDQAVISYARSIGMEVHISTQINITNIETLKFYAMFADTVVLSRELSLGQIKKIVEQVKKQEVKGPSGNLVEVEVFGHGALCMAVSGKCYMSLHTFNSSANRGACKQNCRKPYTVIDKESGVELEIDNEYIMSPQDLCTIDFLDELVEAGVSVLKIEGRGRAPEYVAKTVKTYREAIDAIYDRTYSQEKVAVWMTELAKVYNRGFWGGYYLGKKLGEWSKLPGSQATQKKVFIGTGKHYYPKAKIGEFLIQAFDIKVGDTILVTGPSTGAQELEVTEMFVNDAKSESATKGDTVTFSLPFRIRLSDKLYKVVKTEFAEID